MTTIDQTMLLSVVDTDEKCPIEHEFSTKNKITLDFCDKGNAFGKIKSVFGSNPLYIWIEHGRECGLCPLESIDLFNCDFDFDVDSNGVIVLYTQDCTQAVVLDFYEDSGTCKIDIVFETLKFNK